MTLGQKLKQIRCKFNLSQESLAEIINVSRQAITKWESDNGLPDINNLKELSKVFGITVDYLLDTQSNLPALSMRVEIDKEIYDNKFDIYKKILDHYYPQPYKKYVLTYSNKLGKVEGFLDLLTGGDYDLIKSASDLSPYYLIVKDDLKLLANIKNWILEIIELPNEINIKKFTYDKKKFINCGELK